MEAVVLILIIAAVTIVTVNAYVCIQILNALHDKPKDTPVPEKEEPSRFDQGFDNLMSYMPGKKAGNANEH